MAEVAEAGEPRPALAQHRGRHAQVEAGGREPVRPLRDRGDRERRERGEPGRRQQRVAPRQIGEPADEVRSGRADRERGHQQADCEAAAGAEPGGRDLHGGRIGASQAHPGEEPEREGGGELLHPQRERRVDHRAAERAPHHQRARGGDVGQVGERGEQGAGDEAGLHRDGQAGAPGVAQRPLARQRGQHRGGAEPEGEREQLGEREQAERAPAAAVGARARGRRGGGVRPAVRPLGPARGRGNRSTRRGGRPAATSRAGGRTRP